MIFSNPWAWLGLLALALPIVVHLFARRPARRQPFPTLRFLQATPLTSIRRDRLTDLGLLAVRLSILTMAIWALSQPFWVTPDRGRDLGERLARAIVIDASASMRRSGDGGGAIVDHARREAQRLATEATVARVTESEAPAELVDAARTWLLTQPMRREIVIVSDFQGDAFTAGDAKRIPESIGVRLVRVAPAAGASVAPVAASDRGVTMLAGSAERTGAEAARDAALTRGAPTATRQDWPVTIVFPAYEQRAQLLQRSTPIDRPWMFEVLTAVARARGVEPGLDARAYRGDAASGAPAGLILFTRSTAGSLASAALVDAAMRAVDSAPPAAERRPDALSEQDRAALERPPAEHAPDAGSTDGRSDGRWFWLAALALLGIETLARRPQRPRPSTEVPHERAA